MSEKRADGQMPGRTVGQMLVSADRDRFVEIDPDKVSRGSFYTTDEAWLNAPVRAFLSEAFLTNTSALDPFAGDGHLLDLVRREFGVATFGLDIAGDKWARNDSLVSIPNASSSVIVTNPPYLANHSAKRKGVDGLVATYFDGSDYDNLYKIALDKCLAAADFVVAVIPETFLLSSFDKSRLALVSVIEGDLFADTEAPAVVACFGPDGLQQLGEFKLGNASVYNGDALIGSLHEIFELRTGRARSGIQIVFNDPNGRIGLRAVDSHDGVRRIEFIYGDFEYRRDRIKVSSRLLTYLDVPELTDEQIQKLVIRANTHLEILREKSSDLILAPFKGNDKKGNRRRRLDYALARQIINANLNA
ncbi:hypothetical protein [Rhodoluna lacicola]|uniref:hypothetical protein n=1 Tax=Rhodoluna lacicola TaxID=529884 RepID=UPI00222FAA30|nr:hypothetical protein [Rhodoluna lacicola]BDS49778.1 hypothetical protein RKACHI23_00400 [Rhodoluna lacicola]